ncbi:MAG: type II toxin-antitoxin system HicB family antitoxin [Candidatus Paceibacterota bacterium]|jgi:predicted RNase H-like HicB family nuclease
MKKPLDYYMRLQYHIEYEHDDEGRFVKVKELPGCMSQGDTKEEATENIQDALRGWLEVAYETGMEIPEP